MTSPLKASEVLDRAADLIEPEGRWTQGCLARTADGDPVLERNRKAVCWCLVGSIHRAAENEETAYRTRDWLFAHFDDGWTEASWNDDPTRTQAEVVAKLREGAALAREAGQ